MKKMRAYFIITLIVFALGVYIYRERRATQSLGKATKQKPPKVRLVYSKKVPTNQREKITSSESAADLFRKLWSSQMEIREEFMVLLMDRSNKVIGYQMLSKGGITGTVADIRLILAAAINSLASNIIIAHNHPSGNTQPSEADKSLTKKLKEAAKTMDIALLDHIILTKETYTSFTDEGYL